MCVPICSSGTDQTWMMSSGRIYPPDLFVWGAGSAAPARRVRQRQLWFLPVSPFHLPITTGCHNSPLSQLSSPARGFPLAFLTGWRVQGLPWEPGAALTGPGTVGIEAQQQHSRFLMTPSQIFHCRALAGKLSSRREESSSSCPRGSALQPPLPSGWGQRSSQSSARHQERKTQTARCKAGDLVQAQQSGFALIRFSAAPGMLGGPFLSLL